MIPLDPTHYFHVYNRANGFEKLFVTPGNYYFFLSKYKLYVAPYVDTYCYCLMPNHVHFLLQVRSFEQISEWIANSSSREKVKLLEKFQNDPIKYLSKQFSNLFSSYTQAFNKQQGRMGSLFMKNFNRKPITDELYLKKLVHYIHNNPVEAHLSSGPDGWIYSSYNAIVQQENRFVKGAAVISWFDDLDGFQAFHKLSPTMRGVDDE
jgi:REP element-mobilizing transposase RayT